MSEQDLLKLKEQIKQEIMAEMNTRKRVGTVWETVKKEYEKEIEEANKIPNDNHSLEDALWTIVRAKYGVRSVANINADYEEVKLIVENILNILKEKTRTDNENLEEK